MILSRDSSKFVGISRWSLLLLAAAAISFAGCGSEEKPDKPPEVRLTARVSGTEGLTFFGTVGDQGGRFRQVEGEIPAEYEFRLSGEPGSRAVASFTTKRDVSDLDSGSLQMELIRDGETVRQSRSVWRASDIPENSDENATVSVFWSPSDTAERDAATVRISGTEDTVFRGEIGSAHETRSVFGTLSEEYEIRLDSDDEHEVVRATLVSEPGDDGSCEMKAETVYEGSVVQKGEARLASDGSRCVLNSLWTRDE